MATVAQLDDNCLRAIFLHVPLKDFIKNVQRVSSQFRAGAQSAFNEKFSRDPIEFTFIGSCSHCVFHGRSLAGPRRVSLANFPIPLSKLSEVPNSNLLPYVSKVCLGDAFCEELSDFTPQLKEIMDKIKFACDIRFVLCAAQHYGLSSPGPLREAAFVCANVLRNANAFALNAPLMTSSYSRDDKMDFLQSLLITEWLTSLRVPTSLFAFAVPQAERIFAQLESLEIAAEFEKVNLSCQDIIATVCDSCPQLTKFEYNCESVTLCGCRRGCVFDLNPLTKLTNMRSLTLSLAKMKFSSKYPLVGRLPLVEFLKLKLFCKVPEFCAILKMFPNVKELHFLENFDVPLLYEELRAMLISGQLGQLRAMRISTHKIPLFGGYSYTNMQLLTEIEPAVSLRRLDLHDYDHGIFLGSPSVLSNEHKCFAIPPAKSDVPQFVRQASNVTQLLFNVVWRSDGYEALAEILVAMQEGSLQQLTMRSQWEEIDRRKQALIGCLDNAPGMLAWRSTDISSTIQQFTYSYSKFTDFARTSSAVVQMRNTASVLPIDWHPRFRHLEAVLPAGCVIEKWKLKENRTKAGANANECGENNDLELELILISGHKINAEGEEGCVFWVRLVKGYSGMTRAFFK